MNNKDSKVPIYIAILVTIILIAAGGYFVIQGNLNKKIGSETKSNDAKSDTSMSYHFVDRGHGGVTIELSGSPDHMYTRIDTLETGLSKLRSICNVVSYQTLPIDGTIYAYSVTVEGSCSPNK